MKAPAPGSKEWQVRELRETRSAGRRSKPTTEAKSSKPNSAPVPASAQPQENTMKTKTKAKTKAPKRSVSEAAANLRAAKSSAGKKAAKANARTKVAEPKDGIRPGSKLEIVAGLLTRPEGCTTADVLSACKWPTVSMPQMAKSAGLVLTKEKDGKVTRYRGAPASA